MGFCPYYNLECPESGECQLWDTSAGVCTHKRQKDLLEAIEGGGSPTGQTLYDYDAKGNCIYKGDNEDLEASEDDVDWAITKYTYDQNDYCNHKLKRIGSWTDRETGW